MEDGGSDTDNTEEEGNLARQQETRHPLHCDICLREGKRDGRSAHSKTRGTRHQLHCNFGNCAIIGWHWLLNLSYQEFTIKSSGPNRLIASSEHAGS
jgi:hypothetical protein